MEWGKDTWYNKSFIGSSCDQKAANILLGAPMDYSASYRPGSRFGPEAIRQVSHNLEEYSLYLDRSLEDLHFFDAGDLNLPFGNVPRALEVIQDAVDYIYKNGQKPFIIGGDHLVTYACLSACCQHFSSLNVIHIDAHADLRPNYMDESLSHATVIGAALSNLPLGKVWQFGIRSGTREERQRAMAETSFHPFALVEPLAAVLAEIRGPVYITLDIDVVDPAFAPGTGTPESGGITPVELFKGLSMLSSTDVVGFDLVELAPAYDPAGITAVLGAKIVREALLLYGKQP